MTMAEEAAQKQQQLQRGLSEPASVLPREILENRSKADQVAATFRRSLQSISGKVDGYIADRENVRKLREELREFEYNLNRALSAKACKQVEFKNKEESLITLRTRIEEVKKVLEDTRARREKLAALKSEKLHALEILEEKSSQSTIDKANLEAAILWYKEVLGFQTKGGEGVKFIFNKVDLKDPDKEFSFTVRLEGDTYRLLQCNPALKDAVVLVKELNQTNDLFKFIRDMRKKFLAYAVNESAQALNDICQDSSTINLSSPTISEYTKGGTSTEGVKEFSSTKTRASRRHRAKSPQPVSATRRSPRFLKDPEK